MRRISFRHLFGALVLLLAINGCGMYTAKAVPNVKNCVIPLVHGKTVNVSMDDEIFSKFDRSVVEKYLIEMGKRPVNTKDSDLYFLVDWEGNFMLGWSDEYVDIRVIDRQTGGIMASGYGDSFFAPWYGSITKALISALESLSTKCMK